MPIDFPDPNNSDEQQHDTYAENGFVKCRDCGKMATRADKLEQTPCNSD